jgi:hypothetical protein
MDGYAKYKSLVEKRGQFVCTEQDIKECDEIISRVVRSWSLNLNQSQMTPAMKLAYLDGAHREIFDFIKINQTSSVGGGMDENLLCKLKGATAVQIADELALRGILKVVPSASGCKTFFTYDATYT